MIDFSTLKELYLDGKKVTSLFLDGHEVPMSRPSGPQYLTVTALDQQVILSIKAQGSPDAFSLEYSIGGGSWSTYSAESALTLNAGSYVMFRRQGVETTVLSKNGSNFWYFDINNPVKVSGNIMSLLDASCESTTVGAYAFYRLFNENRNLVDASKLELPVTTLANFCYWSMFQGCTSLTSAPALPATTLANGCYKNMFRDCTSLASMNVKFTAWRPSAATDNWLFGVAATGTFYCPSALGTDATIQRGNNRCPDGWLVANDNVNGYDMQNAFIRGIQTTAFLEDGSSHVPDMNALSVFNGQTAERLYDMTQYTIQLPADTTTAGTKTIQINGIGDYFGTKEISYKIVAKNLSSCTTTVSSVYDNDEVTYIEVVQPDIGYTLVEGTDYTVAVSTSGSQSTVTITGINGWTGTYTTTVAHKTSGTTPITVYKHDSSDTKPLKVAVRSQNFSENISLQCKADSNAWTAMNIDAQLTANSQVQIRAVDANRRLATSDNNYLWIDTGYDDSTAAAAAVSGNIISLVDRSETQDRISADHTFAGTFANNDNLIDASHLSCSQVSSNVTRALRAVCAGRGMGFGILNGNPSQLTGAPDLFANVSAYGNRQYQMGDTCRSCPALTSVTMTIPALAQSTFNSYSIGNACFSTCTSLISAVVKSHNGDGYVPSYFNCLEATFSDCSNLTCISTDLTAWPSNGFNEWVKNVAATGTFICPTALGTDATIQRGASYCPTGWTVVNT